MAGQKIQVTNLKCLSKCGIFIFKNKQIAKSGFTGQTQR
jgi:hypothetical protein